MAFGRDGERGMQGDHGQTGADGQDGRIGYTGERGMQGEPGRDGVMSDDAFERTVVEITSKALAKRRLRTSDRRLQILFAGLVLLGFWAGWTYSHDREEASRFQFMTNQNCELTREGNLKVNGLLERLARSASANTTRTVEENAEIVASYRGLVLPVPDCTPMG